MVKVGVTGSQGLIGWHVRAFLYGQDEIEVLAGDRSTFASPERLARFASSCDVIVHLAGMNRGDDAAIESTNVALTESLIEQCERLGHRPHLIFSSSVHVHRDTAYGRSKRRATELLRRWSQDGGGPLTNLVLPHVFGEGGKPFYNSVVSTFCHQLAAGEQPTIQDDGMLELVHAQEVAAQVLAAIRHGASAERTLSGERMRVSELLAKLEGFVALYDQRILPDLRQEIDLDLFNTYRSYLDPRPFAPRLHTDPRGTLFETVKTRHGGQAFVSTTKPGVTRGDHYHLKKLERFVVLAGEVIVRVRKLFTDEVTEYRIGGARPQFLDIPTLYAHNLTNVGESDLLMLFWAHEIFDPERPDTYPEAV